MELMERRRILLNTPHINIITGLQFVTDMVAPLESLVIGFSPIQDLHGYNSPWPAGGGKNLLNANADTGSSNNVNYIKNGDGTYTVNGTADGTSSFIVGSIELTANTQYVLSGCPNGGSGSSYNVRIRDANYTALGFDAGNGTTITPTETKTYYYQITVVSGYSVSNLVFKPMVCLSTASNPDYAHFAPYSNICPISGRTGLDVTITGKNLFDGEFELGIINGITGADGVNANYIRAKDYIPVQESNTYTISSPDYNGNWFVYEYTEDKTYNLASNKTTADAFTTNAGTKYVRFRPNAQVSTVPLTTKAQIELGSTATAYEPYQNTTYPISWQTEAGTVYGGTIDVVTGLLTATHGYLYFDGTDSVNYVLYSNSNNVYYTAVVNTINGVNTNVSNPLYSSMFKSNTSLKIGNSYVANNGHTIVVVLPDQTITTKEQGTQWFRDNPTQFVYPLAEPVTYQLTPQQVLAFKGINNLSMSGQVKFWTHRD